VDESRRYEVQVDLTAENSSHTQMVLLTGENKDVLEVGTSTGYVARVLRERGCRVTGIEVDTEMAREAEGSVDRMIVGDIESLDLEELLGAQRFDVILFGDVLEHLVDPGGVLRRVTPFLAADGRVVASIPNIAHGSVRLSLLAGDFTYTESGLLDRTHLRFFTRDGVESLFTDAGFDILEWRRVELGLFETEAPIREEDVPPALAEGVAGAPEARTFQFVIAAAPRSEGSPRAGTREEARTKTTSFEAIWELEGEVSRLRSAGGTDRSRASEEAREASLLTEASEIPEEDREALLASHERHRGSREVRSVNWFVPDFDNAYYGGMHTILRFADRLHGEHGVESRMIICGQGPEEKVRAAIAEAFPALADAPMVVAGNDPEFERRIPKADAGVATLWATTHPLVRSRSAERAFYLVQDFEPMFYPAGTLYALAEETYRLGLYGITNGPVLKDLYESYGSRATSFMPQVDLDLFHPDEGRGRAEPFTVFMYGRPGHPRNCYELGIAALRRLKDSLGDRVRILAAGSTETSGGEDWIEHLGLLPYEETAELYRRCDAGLALSVSMHPSYIPFQLMASGALVVANRNPATAWLLRDRENALLATASPGALHDALLEGLTDDPLRERLTGQAVADIRERHADWNGQIDEVFRFLQDPRSAASLAGPAHAEGAASTLDARKAALAQGEWRAFEGTYRALIKEKDLEIEEQALDLAERQEALRQEREVSDDLRAVLRGKAEQIGEKDLAIVKRDWVVSGLERRIAELERGRTGGVRGRARRLLERVAPFGTLRRELLRRLGIVSRALPTPRVPTGLILEPGRDPDAYELWLHRNQLNDDLIAQMRDAIARFEYRPTISVIVPTYNSDPDWLGEAIDSVRAQVYDAWELCIADDGSTRAETRAMLRRYDRGDPRIKVTFLRQNQGISGASNAALELATGEFVALLDHDDVIHPEALFEVVKVLNERSDTDFVYTDEDKLELDGRRIEPFFKPDWSPDLLDSLNYVTHLSVFRKELVDRLGGFRKGFEGSQDYDLILRVADAATHIEHVARPVYSWRKVPGSAAASSEAKPYAYEAAKRALEESLTRRGYDGEVLDGPFTGHYRVKYELRERPRVSIVIPTRDRVDLLGPCVDSIRARTSYDAYDIVVVDNESEEPETREYLRRFEGTVIPYHAPFNFARMMNHALERIGTPMVVFLNNDTEVVSEEWLEALLEHGQRPEVAAVGARLLYPDGEPQHEGILIGTGDGLAANIVAKRYGFGVATRNVSAVTAACMLMRTEVFRELGGFDEDLEVAYNDVDLCLRAREKGYLIVYTPYALLQHEQGGSRGIDGKQPPQDRERFRRRWRGYRDPYYNPNLDIERPFKLQLEW
jgi:GT2 family glycosyltransferase/2-polyprenyl-3-methyl-5-hydroxy-6-metoxy-1,4-benzoquinol methylase